MELIPTWTEVYEGQDDREFWQVETPGTCLNYEPELLQSHLL